MDGAVSLSKMVDYTICLEPQNELEQLMLSTLDASYNESINVSQYQPLRYRPIGVSIETKRTGENYHEAAFQLQVWLAAQFKKLETLGNPFHSRPESLFFPGIIIQGHNWLFVAAVKDPTTSRITFYDQIRIGDTQNLENFYRVIVTLQRLAQWVKSTLPSLYTDLLSVSGGTS